MKVRAALVCAATLLALSARPTSALTSSAGFKAGVNFAEFAGDMNLRDANTRADIMGGAFIQTAINTQAAVRIETMWVSKGTDFSDSDPDDSSIELGYIELPLLFVVDLRPEEQLGLSIFLGPTFGVNVTAKTVENGFSFDIEDYVDDFEFGIAVGIGFEYALPSMSIVVDARYTSGHTHAIQILTEGDSIDVHNRGIGIMAGLAFPLGDQAANRTSQ